MPPTPDDDLQALFDQTASPPPRAQQERWARHAATLPDRPRRRWWWWLIPAAAVPAAAAVFALWPPGDGPAANRPDLDPSAAPAAIGAVPPEELGGLDLLLVASDDAASLDRGPSSPLGEDPPRGGAGRMPAVTQDPLRVLDGFRDPMGALELLGPPLRPHLARELAAFEALLEEKP